MFKLCYWSYSRQVHAYFESYADAMKARNQLKERYPDSKIWVEGIRPWKYDEWRDRTNGKIANYEMSNSIRKCKPDQP